MKAERLLYMYVRTEQDYLANGGYKAHLHASDLAGDSCPEVAVVSSLLVCAFASN